MKGPSVLYSLFLRDYEILARIGVYDEEKARPQRLLVNVVLILKEQGQKDQLDETLDYDFLRVHIKTLAEDEHILLQETFCRKLLAICKNQNNVAGVRLSTEKLDIYKDAKSIGCSMLWIADDLDPLKANLLFGSCG